MTIRLSIDELSFPNSSDEILEALNVKIPMADYNAQMLKLQLDGESKMEQAAEINKIVTTAVRNAMAPLGIVVKDEASQVFDACEGAFSVTATGKSGEGVGFIVVTTEEDE